VTPEELKRKDTDRLKIERYMKIMQAAASNELSPEVPDRVMIKNISGGGLCVTSEKVLRAGVVIEAEVMLYADGLERFKVYCQAVWARRSESTGLYEAGLRFLGIKETDGIQLKEYIKEHLN
jgi:c-di-GMP-binding flagellar brake protein YcgR